MSSVTFPTSLGGNGLTYTDADMLNGGHETRFVPMLAQEVIMANSAASNAVVASNAKDNASASATSAASSASSAATSAATALSVAAQDLTAISKTISGTAVAVFVYDTRNDSDGGRVARNAGLPSLMGIVATATSVVVFKGTDTAATAVTTISSLSGVTSVFAIHGRLFIGSSSGVAVYDMLNSFTLLFTYSTSSSPAIVANSVQCLTGTVLPTAPIDVATGLPTPTVWVGTLGGVSRIAHDGTVSNWTESGSVDDVYNIGITGDYVYFATDNTTANKYVLAFTIASALSASLYTSTTYEHITGASADSWLSTKFPIHYGATNSQIRDITRNAIATNRSLTLIQPNTTTWGSGLYATITKDFNTGWQFGDIRGAWLANATAETLTAANLVTGDNSTFTSGVGGWYASYAETTLAAVSGKLEVTSSGSDTAHACAVGLIVSGLTVGKSYILSADLERISGRQLVALSANSGSNTLVYQSTVGTYTTYCSFVAGLTTVTITLYEAGASEAAGLSFRADNVTVKLADPDYSYKNQALDVVGSLTKAAVNTGCELMGYSGWSVSNYLQEAYNSAKDYGTASFNIRFWLKCAATAANETVLERDSASTAQRFTVEIAATTSYLSFTCDDNTTTRTATSAVAVDDGLWHFYECIYDGAGGVYIYRDGSATAFASATGAALLTLNNASATFTVGATANAANPLTNGTLSLLHTGAGNPSATQIKAAYESEKVLFQTNAKCLLAGTSNDVKAVDYDPDTGIHHCVTGDYYNAFKGLTRVDSASGVWTSVSAKNGLVIKGA